MKTPQDIEKYSDHYSSDKFWKKLGKVARKVGEEAVYNALVLYYALQNPSISLKDKSIILGALGYFILPVDLIPDFIPAFGFSDDIAALGLALYKVAKSVTPEVRLQAREKTSQWFGTAKAGSEPEQAPKEDKPDEQ